MTVMDDLIAFLRARLDEQERAAKAMKRVYPTPWEVADRGWMARVTADKPHFHEVIRLEQHQAPDAAEWLGGVVEHVALNNPDFALADVEGKRLVIKLYENAVSAKRAGTISDRNRTQDEAAVDVLGAAVQSLALAYAGRDDYLEEWKP